MANPTIVALTYLLIVLGHGLSTKDLPHVFERFYRGEAGSTRPAGSGMGLWIAHGLLAAQQGRIWVENEADGGARFTIVVPSPGRPTAPATMTNDRPA